MSFDELMPRPPFILSREGERTAIDRAVRDPAKRQMLYEMVEVVFNVRETNSVSSANLAAILGGFEVSDEAVWSRAAGWLAKLHAFSSTMESTLNELMHHRSAAVRFRLCASLDRFPEDVAVPRLRYFLSDRSAQVSGTVLNVAVKAGYTQLIPDFEKLLRKAEPEDRRLDIRQAIALLKGETFERDSWLVRRLSDGTIEYAQPD